MGKNLPKFTKSLLIILNILSKVWKQLWIANIDKLLRKGKLYLDNDLESQNLGILDMGSLISNKVNQGSLRETY